MREWSETERYLREIGVEPPTAPPPVPIKEPSPLDRLLRYFSAFRNRPGS